MITTLLLLLLLACMLWQPTIERLVAAGVFIGITLSYDLVSQVLEGQAYYICAALADLLIMILLKGIPPACRLVLDLQKVCLASILINGFGWVLWYFYLPPAAYDAAMAVVYLWAVVVLIKKGGVDVGANPGRGRRAVVPRHHRAQQINLFKDKGGA